MANNNPVLIIVMGAFGRMGKTIIRLAEENPAFNIVAAVDQADIPWADVKSRLNTNIEFQYSNNLDDILKDCTKKAVIINFTAPEATINSAKIAAKYNFPMVIGTTGFSEEQKEELRELAKNTPLLWSANMSIGVNVLLRFLPQLAVALGDNYDVEMMEIHHRLKKDAPSGTALMLGEGIAQAKGWALEEVRTSNRDGIIGERPDKQIGIQALRGGDVVGIHECYFLGPGEIIEVKHQAESRENFASGALRAAAWLLDQVAGQLYSMQDVIMPQKRGNNTTFLAKTEDAGFFAKLKNSFFKS